MTLPCASPACKLLILGTALWGWGIDRTTAHGILDRFVLFGGRIVDTATNYPINGRSEDFGMAKAWIAEWIASNGEDSLSVLMKIGAVDNSGGSRLELARSFIRESEDSLRASFGRSLAAIAVHWDNRGEAEGDPDRIFETVNAMEEIFASGLSIGFSGVRRPDLYLRSSPHLADKWWIQVKENVFSSAARVHCSTYFPKARYLAYGVNMGGVKSVPPSSNSSLALRGVKHPDELAGRLTELMTTNQGLRPQPKNLNEFALFSSFVNPDLCGVIIGPRNIDQLENSAAYWQQLKAEKSALTSLKMS